MSFVYQSKNTLASEEDVEKLSELGYKQELYRGMNVLMTFSTSFTAVAAGSVYYWSAVMGSRFVGYVDGWFNLMGNSAADAFFASSFATFINAILFIAGTDQLTNNQQVALSTGVLAYWSLYNLLRVDIQGYINYLGAFWQFGSTAAVILTMYISCERSISQTTLGEMFTETYNGTSIESFGYVVLIGTLSAFYSFTGYGNYV
ncbi:hypothetical protein HK103_005610 [Boothiomyces macroporosus]|uniref:Uncharacterized protein n=1 Tax=Boothiomyces macroporosus TaxID=261099 RepID=A0AAD5Y560_9FUNG|nr:hypothetical protein HK103_005610 [Boothiomyces macroporosus]